MIHGEETDEHALISIKVADAACRDRCYSRNSCGAADAPRGRQRFEECGQRDGMADLRSQLFRATLQHVKTSRYDERQPLRSCVVVRGRTRWWTARSNATVRK